MKKLEATFNYIGTLLVPEWVVNDCPKIGKCDDFIKEAREYDEVKEELAKIDPEQLRKELYEYGAWDDEQLSNHEDNLDRILWVAIFDIYDLKNED